MRRILPVLAAVAALASSGCVIVHELDESQPLTVQVTFEEQPEGLDSTAPTAFSNDPVEYQLRVEVLGHDRSPVSDFDGLLSVKATPGELRTPASVQLAGGVWTGTVEVARAYDELRIWFADEGTADSLGSFATGVTPSIHIDLPTVTDVQTSDSVVESHFEREYVPIKGWDGTDGQRDLVVTTVSNDGFYVTDRTEGPGTYNSLFVFSFSRPDGIEVGDRLSELSGIVSEFLGYTELGFPTWQVADRNNVVDEPYEIDPTIVCDSPEMEKWEASVIRLDGLRSDFSSGSDCEDYTEHAQWPALIEGVLCGGEPARISVVNENTVPSFNFPPCSLAQPPTDAHDREIGHLIGVLRHLQFASPPWILEVRSCLDFPEDLRPADCEQLLMRPPSGPRIAPAKYYRDLVTCEGVPYRLD
jgi:hypothetical protein